MTLEGNAEARITLHQGRGRGQGAGTARRGIPEVQRGGGHPDRARHAARDRSCRGRADVAHRQPDRALERRRVRAGRNTTRTVTEASATVKGLTGLDVPALISNAMGGATTQAAARQAPSACRTGGGGPFPSGGSGGSGKQTRSVTRLVPMPSSTASVESACFLADRPAADGSARKPVETMARADAAIAQGQPTPSNNASPHVKPYVQAWRTAVLRRGETCAAITSRHVSWAKRRHVTGRHSSAASRGIDRHRPLSR